jgi:hypothetical protein
LSASRPAYRPTPAETERDHPERVKPLAGPFTVVVEHPQRPDDRQHPRRHVDPEDPPPRDVGHDQPAEHDAQHRPDRPAESGEPVGPAAALARVQIGDHGAAVSHDQRTANALHDPENDD